MSNSPPSAGTGFLGAEGSSGNLKSALAPGCKALVPFGAPALPCALAGKEVCATAKLAEIAAIIKLGKMIFMFRIFRFCQRIALCRADVTHRSPYTRRLAGELWVSSVE